MAVCCLTWQESRKHLNLQEKKILQESRSRFAQMRGFVTYSSPASPTPKKSWCISVSFPSLKHKSAELPYHSRTQREMGLCSARSKVHPMQTHLFLQATWVQRRGCQNPAGCRIRRAQRHGEVRCTESPVSSLSVPP